MDLPSDPKRIVTIGWNGEDCLLALGIVPIAMPRYQAFADGIFPWNEERLSGSAPLLMAGGIDFEAIAALHPDLILGIHSGLDARDYSRLSRIAPTVLYRSSPWGADWREQMTITGEALGRAQDASAIISNTGSFLRRTAEAHPQLRGRSFAFGTFMPGASGVVVYLPSDQRVEVLTGLGLHPSASVEDLARRNPGLASITIGLEELDRVDADILIMWYVPGAKAAMEAQPLFQTLGAVRRGAYVALEDPVEVWSTSALSVLSIPYGFPRFIPRLADAASRAEGR